MDVTISFAIFFQAILAIESTISFLGNGLIIAVNGHRWLQNGKMAPCDFLLTSLSTSRIVWQLTLMIYFILYFNCRGNHMCANGRDICTFFWMFLSNVSLWCATCLNIFFFVKVTNFPHHLFLWMKLRINVLAPRLLGMVIIALLLFSVHPTILYFENRKHCPLIGTLMGNATLNKVCHYQFFVFRTLHFFSICMSFSISLTASISLLISLWRHIRNLRKSNPVIKDLSTQVYLKVMKSFLFSLFFDFTYFAVLIIPLGGFFTYDPDFTTCIAIVLSALPSAHTIILILSNPKLKEILVRILNIRRRAT